MAVQTLLQPLQPKGNSLKTSISVLRVKSKRNTSRTFFDFGAVKLGKSFANAFGTTAIMSAKGNKKFPKRCFRNKVSQGKIRQV